ncbi:hypothetical protein HHI36_007491 [Cryptolaemus montrouzieri]|uniref:Major facilitator superfamily (MFS) profile domain-containing protein n=1 Tax=Cryptolaemus montrouzieri TaxID=559131 RepID=A0ABD2MPP2_9CUCU
MVVPIIPDHLFTIELNLKEQTHSDFASSSSIQREYEGIDKENGLLGALLASKAFVQLLFTPIIGYWITRVGCSLPMLIGSCNMLLSSLLFAYGKSYRLLIIARALHGSSSAAISISGMSLLAKHVPSELRPKLMPLSFGGIALGVLVGYPFGGAAYQHFGKETTFILISLMISFNIGLQLNLMNKFNIDRIEQDSDDLKVLDLLKDRKTMIATCAIGVSTTTMAVLEPCIPIWLLGHFYPPPPRWLLGAVFIPDSIGYFLGSHFGGFIPIDNWRIALIVMIVGGLSSCSVPLVDSVSQLSLPHFGIGLSVGVIDAILVPYLATLMESKRSTKYGSVYTLQQMAVSLAYCLGPLIGGEAVYLIGFTWLMKIVGLMNVAFCPLLVELEEVKTGNKDGMVSSINKSSTLDTYQSLEEDYPKNSE